jgi:single-stranded DNA-specific DHH superfamily exonuclease
MNLRNWQEFVQRTIDKRGLQLTTLYRLVELIGGVEVVAESEIGRLFWVFYDAKDQAAILDGEFKGLLEKFRVEKGALVEGFEEKAEKFPGLELFFYAIRAKHENIKSYVINEISEMHPNNTVILLQYRGAGRVRFSARRQDGKVKVNDLLVEATKGIPESVAGGHGPAAAGSIPRNYLAKFKSNVISILEKQYKS